jgi:7-cyano-7-deazaguanine reductase
VLFYIALSVAIRQELVRLLQPLCRRLGVYFYPRGGMPIDVFWQAGKLPAGTWVPDQGVSTYRARL